MDQITDREWQRLLSPRNRYLTLQSALPDALIPESMGVGCDEYQEPEGAEENEHPALGLLDGAAPAKPGNLP